MKKTAKKDLVFRKTQKTALKRHLFVQGIPTYQQAHFNQSGRTPEAFKRILNSRTRLIFSFMSSFCTYIPQKLVQTNTKKVVAQALVSKERKKAPKIAFLRQASTFLWFPLLQPFLERFKGIPAHFKLPSVSSFPVREPFPFPFSTHLHARYCHS